MLEEGSTFISKMSTENEQLTQVCNAMSVCMCACGVRWHGTLAYSMCVCMCIAIARGEANE